MAIPLNCFWAVSAVTLAWRMPRMLPRMLPRIAPADASHTGSSSSSLPIRLLWQLLLDGDACILRSRRKKELYALRNHGGSSSSSVMCFLLDCYSQFRSDGVALGWQSEDLSTNRVLRYDTHFTAQVLCGQCSCFAPTTCWHEFNSQGFFHTSRSQASECWD